MKFNPFCRSVKHPVLLWDRGRVCGRPLLREYVPTDNNAKGGPLTGTGVIVRQIYHPVHSLPWYSAYTLVDLLGEMIVGPFTYFFTKFCAAFLTIQSSFPSIIPPFPYDCVCSLSTPHPSVNSTVVLYGGRDDWIKAYYPWQLSGLIWERASTEWPKFCQSDRKLISEQINSTWACRVRLDIGDCVTSSERGEEIGADLSVNQTLVFGF